MTVGYIQNNDIHNLPNVIAQENDLNIQYNSEFVSNSQIDLSIINYSIYIYERYLFKNKT